MARRTFPVYEKLQISYLVCIQHSSYFTFKYLMGHKINAGKVTNKKHNKVTFSISDFED